MTRVGCTGCDTGVPHLHMSDLGSCVKAQVAGLLGYKPVAAPEKMEAIYARGHAHEEECAEAMKVDGFEIRDFQQEIIIDGALPVYGHLDGVVYDMIRDPDAKRFTNVEGVMHPNLVPSAVWEAKAPGAWARFEQAVRLNSWTDPLMHRYAWQISCYMHATGLEALVCCVDDGRVKTFGIEVPPFTLAAIQQRVEHIANMVAGRTLPGDCSQVDYPCPFVYLHTAKPDRTVITDKTIIDAADRYAILGNLEQAAKKEKKQLRLILDPVFGVVGDYTAGEVDITVYSRKNPVKLDEEAMRADGIDVESYRKSDGESVAMKVTPKKG